VGVADPFFSAWALLATVCFCRCDLWETFLHATTTSHGARVPFTPLVDAILRAMLDMAITLLDSGRAGTAAIFSLFHNYAASNRDTKAAWFRAAAPYFP
jgi:hypothetical protein